MDEPETQGFNSVAKGIPSKLLDLLVKAVDSTPGA